MRQHFQSYVATLAETWAHLSIDDTLDQIEAHVISEFGDDFTQVEYDLAVYDAMHLRALREDPLHMLACPWN